MICNNFTRNTFIRKVLRKDRRICSLMFGFETVLGSSVRSNVPPPRAELNTEKVQTSLWRASSPDYSLCSLRPTPSAWAAFVTLLAVYFHSEWIDNACVPALFGKVREFFELA